MNSQMKRYIGQGLGRIWGTEAPVLTELGYIPFLVWLCLLTQKLSELCPFGVLMEDPSLRHD